jgi:hypothetical protein
LNERIKNSEGGIPQRFSGSLISYCDLAYSILASFRMGDVGVGVFPEGERRNENNMGILRFNLVGTERP